MMLKLPQSQLRTVLGAARALASVDGAFEEHERQLIGAAARTLGHEGDIDAIEPVSPEQAGEAGLDELTRTRLVQSLLLLAAIDGEVSASELLAIRAYASALGVSEPRLKNLEQIANGHMRLVKMDLLRKSEMVRTAAKKAWEDKGLRGLWTVATSMYGLSTDAELAWRYKALGLLPEGTFGRAYWAHMTERRYALPGEPMAFPEELAKHDLAHVLGGYDTDPEGECEVVAFISGFMKTDPFSYLFMIVIHMQLGVHIFEGTPVEHMKVSPERLVLALERGSRVTRDLYDPAWDYWAEFPLPLGEVRQRYGIS